MAGSLTLLPRGLYAAGPESPAGLVAHAQDHAGHDFGRGSGRILCSIGRHIID